ncbi:hypothetical protein BC829DRAFT_386526 [Chytridium lagenaria]|nr:hypothetical protein BC829DRAFT_386526 [Chytridium lagenaria]
MAAPPPQKTGSAHQDVMQFLQDLDSLNLQPSDKASSPAPNSKSVDDTPAASAQSTQDVLSFLDELTAAPTKPTSPKTPTTSSRQPSKPDSLPSASHLSSRGSPTRDSWSWNSLWSQAQATASNITAATGASLSLAQHIVEDAAKVVTSEKVKGLVANVSTNLTDSVHNVVNNNRVQSLSNDISKFTISSVSTISDILARRLGLFARTITVWMCALTADPAGPTDLGPTHDQVHDFVQATGNALWITDRPEQGICSKLVVNGVANPDPQSAKGFNEAIEIVEPRPLSTPPHKAFQRRK